MIPYKVIAKWGRMTSKLNVRLLISWCVCACRLDSYYRGNSFQTYRLLFTVISGLMKNQNSSESTKCDSGP